METAVLIPVKAFHAAKARLSGYLSDDDRNKLARWTASRVVKAAGERPVFIACDDDEVASWAEQHGAQVLWRPGLGLNGAIDSGIETIEKKGIEYVTIAHGDLPLPHAISELGSTHRIVLVPDRQRAGTNVLARPCKLDLPASYGPGSFHRHLASALRTGTPVCVRADTELSIDIDTIDDCRHPLVAPLIKSALEVGQ